LDKTVIILAKAKSTQEKNIDEYSKNINTFTEHTMEVQWSAMQSTVIVDTIITLPSLTAKLRIMSVAMLLKLQLVVST